MTIASSGLSDSQIEQMVQEAEQHAVADKEKRELIEISVGSASTCSDTQKSLDEFKDQLDKTEVETVQKLIDELKEIAQKGQEGEGSAEEIKSKKDALLDASLGLFSKVRTLLFDFWRPVFFSCFFPMLTAVLSCLSSPTPCPTTGPPGQERRRRV